MKKLFFILLLTPLLSFAQKTYTVGPKETLFSIGRALKIHPRELAEYNNIPFEDGVKVGQVLKIPAVKKMAPLPDVAPATTPVTLKDPVAKPVSTPVTIAPKPTAVPVTATTSKPIPVAVTKPTPTPIPVTTTAAKPAPATSSVTTVPVKPASVVKPTEKSVTPAGMQPIYHKVQKKETLFQISQTEKVSIDDIKKWNKLTVDGVNEGVNLIVGYKNHTTDPIAKKETPIKPAPPVVAAPTEIKQTPVVTSVVVVTENEAKPQHSGSVIIRDFQGGYFNTAYSSQNSGKSSLKSENGTAAVFKSTSGWNDGKYYCLYNAAPSGTILKITNKANQKSIFAKVLDVIPDLKQNDGLLIRLSNAAADELGASAETFDVILSY